MFLVVFIGFAVGFPIPLGLFHSLRFCGGQKPPCMQRRPLRRVKGILKWLFGLVFFLRPGVPTGQHGEGLGRVPVVSGRISHPPGPI